MRKQFALLAVFAVLASSAFAHAGHAHIYMGTVTSIHDDEFMIRTTDDKDVTIKTSSTTRYLHADNQPGTRSELAEGVRVVVKMNTDGQTAASVKIASGKNTN
jgi:uncharacterized protein YrrD